MLTWIEISKSAIEYNIKQFRKIIGGNILLMPVIKSNAYGHGFLEVAKILNKEKEVDRICVVNLEEAIKLLDNKLDKKQIQILSFFEWDKDKITKAIKKSVIFPIYSLEYAKKLNSLAKKNNRIAKIEIKIDTGTSRIGIMPKNAVNFVKSISKLKNLEVNGIYSHFASSEENNEQTKKQLCLFNQVIFKLNKEKIKIPFKHITCSAASIIHKKSHFNAVRFGISLYGLHSTKNTLSKIKLKPVLSWYTKIIQTKSIPKNSKVSYGGTYKTKKETKIGILPIGYYDGYGRSLSNNSKVAIKGIKCPVLGIICMNMTIIDLTEIKNVKDINRVELIGKTISADYLAKQSNTINYEITTKLNYNIKRKIVR